MGNFSFHPPVNLLDEVTSFEAKNSVFNTADGNNSFSTLTPIDWSSRGGAETINRLIILLSLDLKMILNYI